SVQPYTSARTQSRTPCSGRPCRLPSIVLGFSSKVRCLPPTPAFPLRAAGYSIEGTYRHCIEDHNVGMDLLDPDKIRREHEATKYEFIVTELDLAVTFLEIAAFH